MGLWNFVKKIVGLAPVSSNKASAAEMQKPVQAASKAAALTRRPAAGRTILEPASPQREALEKFSSAARNAEGAQYRVDSLKREIRSLVGVLKQTHGLKSEDFKLLAGIKFTPFMAPGGGRKIEARFDNRTKRLLFSTRFDNDAIKIIQVMAQIRKNEQLRDQLQEKLNGKRIGRVEKAGAMQTLRELKAKIDGHYRRLRKDYRFSNAEVQLLSKIKLAPVGATDLAHAEEARFAINKQVKELLFSSKRFNNEATQIMTLVSRIRKKQQQAQEAQKKLEIFSDTLTQRQAILERQSTPSRATRAHSRMGV